MKSRAAAQKKTSQQKPRQESQKTTVPVHCAHNCVEHIDALTPHPRNPNKHPDEQIRMLAKIINHQGWRSPVVVSKRSGFVIKGHGRLAAARANGWSFVPVDKQDYADEATEWADLIADNRIAELAEPDPTMLRDIIGDFDAGYDFEFLGFNADGLELLNASAHIESISDGDIQEDDIPDPPDEPITKEGDVWILGRHWLTCGDASKLRPKENEFDIVFTDPPYGVNYVSRVDEKRRKNWGGIKNDDLNDEDLADLLRQCIPESPYRFICCDWHCYAAFEAALGKPKSVCVWDKGHFGLGMGYRRQHEFVMFYGTLNRSDLSDMWPFPRDSNYQHPTQKPVALVAKALRDVAQQGAKKVYDPFCGSGSTIIAAEHIGIVAHGVEIEPKYCDVIVQRWEKLMGQKAKRA